MQVSDIKLYRAKVNTDTVSNGGRESYAEIVSALLNNMFPSVTQDERTAGLTRLRKGFARNRNTLEEPFQNGQLFIKAQATGEDYYILMAGTQRGTQGDLVGNEKQYGAGVLTEMAGSGQLQVKVAFDDADEVDLAQNDAIWLSGANGQMFNTVANVPAWNGNVATFNVGTPLSVDFPIGSACAMCINAGTLATSLASWQETSAAGTYDEQGHPVTLKNRGTVDDDWTITMTDATHFLCTGLYEGAVGSGVISEDFSPVNPNTGVAYFTLAAAGWGGAWAVGETIRFTTHPSSYPVWVKEIVPAGASANGDDQTTLRLDGE
jgi:hypothetical protein